MISYKSLSIPLDFSKVLSFFVLYFSLSIKHNLASLSSILPVCATIYEVVNVIQEVVGKRGPRFTKSTSSYASLLSKATSKFMSSSNVWPNNLNIQLDQYTN